MASDPRLEIHFLGSGSKGNATLIRCGETRLLIDCGFSGRELLRRLALVGASLDQLDAVLLTHEHGDHVQALPVLAKHERLRVYASAGTLGAARFGPRARCQRIPVRPGQELRVGAVVAQVFGTSHDASEPVGCVLELAGGARLGLATDLGVVSRGVISALQGCDYLGLECNHDVEMLLNGPYPWILKRRIQSRRGHLCNEDAAALLEQVASPRLRQVFALHISENNNLPELATRALEGILRRRGLQVPVKAVAQGSPTTCLCSQRAGASVSAVAGQIALL